MPEDQPEIDKDVEDTQNQGEADCPQPGEPELNEAEKQAVEAMTTVAAVANRLVRNDQRYGRLVASMLASRQLYAMCLYELERLCDDTDYKKSTKQEDEPDLAISKTLPDEQLGMLKEILINSAAVQAQQPFDEQQLFTGMVNTVFPWMRDVVALHNQMQNERRKKDFEAAEAIRVANKIAFNVQVFPADEENDGYWIGRDKPVLLVGWEPATRWLMDHIIENSLKQGNNVAQVLRLNAGGKPKHNDPKVWYVQKDDWKAVAETNTAFQRLYEASVMHNLTFPVDLLLVDDLCHARNDLSFTNILTRANEAQKKFKNWAKEAGCLLIGCMPLDRQLKANELHVPDYETLRMHNVLRGVVAEQTKVDGQDYYKILVGQHEVARVPVDEVKAYTQSNIIKA